MSNSNRQPRKNAEQWQTLIEQQATSGLSVPQFCRQHDIAYQSFMQWRKKLACTDASSEDSHSGFVEITTPEAISAAGAAASPWHIELDLAPGVQLRISH